MPKPTELEWIDVNKVPPTPSPIMIQTYTAYAVLLEGYPLWKQATYVKFEDGSLAWNVFDFNGKVNVTHYCILPDDPRE